MSSEPSPFLHSLLKAELHLHLEGSIEPATLLELRHRRGEETATLAEVEPLYQFTDSRDSCWPSKTLPRTCSRPTIMN